MPPKDKDESQIPPYDNDTGLSMADSEIDNWVPSDGLQSVGTVDSLDPSFNVTYGNVGTADMFEEELKKKYPALKDAWNHYQNVKQMCETREKEEDGS
jgi:hypothetical protein